MTPNTHPKSTPIRSACANAIETATALLLRLLWCVLVFAIPFRWNYAATALEQALFPQNIWEWLLFSIQPHFLLAACAGALLLLSVARYPTPPNRSAALCVPLLTFSPLLFGLAGLVHTTEAGYALAWFRHFYVVACISVGIWWTSRHDRRLLPWLLNAIAAAALLTACEGWTQHFGGLQAQYEEQLENAHVTGMQLSDLMTAKFRQTRSLGSFGDPNSYAAQLLLTCPFLILAAVRLGKKCTTAPRTAEIILGASALILSVGALLFSGSRGAALGALAGVVVALLAHFGTRLRRWQKGALVAGALLCACVAIAGLNVLSQRKMETVTVRLEYYTAAWKTYRHFPVFGAGLGEFFPWHLRLKTWEGDDARDPHSLFFAQLSQCGVPGAIDALLRIGLPLLLAMGLFRKARHGDAWQATATLAAWVAWNAHALLQFNDTIVSTATLAGFVGLFFFQNDTAEEPSNCTTARRWRWIPAVALLLLAAGALWELRQIPSARAMQRAEDALQQTAWNQSNAAYATCRELHLEALQRDRHAVQPARALADLALADRELWRRDFETARQAVDELVRRAPHRSSTHLREWRLAVATYDKAAAEAALEKMALWHPTNPTLWLIRALQQRIPPLYPVDLLRLSRPTLEKGEVTDSEIHFKTRPPSEPQRFLYEGLLRPILRNGIPEDLSGRTIIIQLD